MNDHDREIYYRKQTIQELGRWRSNKTKSLRNSMGLIDLPGGLETVFKFIQWLKCADAGLKWIFQNPDIPWDHAYYIIRTGYFFGSVGHIMRYIHNVPLPKSPLLFIQPKPPFDRLPIEKFIFLEEEEEVTEDYDIYDTSWMVMNQEGSVTFDRESPQIDTPITAILNDPDGDIGNVEWNWRIEDPLRWRYISGAHTATYTPKKSDIGKRLNVVVAYTDRANRDINTKNIVKSDPTTKVSN